MQSQIGLGMDAGGSFTDAVLYDFANRTILATAKAPTTHQDLTLGICAALDQLPEGLLHRVDRVALSTTLATNACVEDRGGTAKLVFIGLQPRDFSWAGADHGLPPVEEMVFLPAPAAGHTLFETPAEWQAFWQQHRAALCQADGVGVVALRTLNDPDALEDRLCTLLQQQGIATVCGHELSDQPNAMRRGVGAMLNIRLIPVIGRFLAAMRGELQRRGISADITITRSDGSVMSQQLTSARPIETLLCGPAAGVVGGAHLTGQTDCVIVDMGGTTTDIAIVRNGTPLPAGQGIRIGRWRTPVRGVFIDTISLGGDTRLKSTPDGRLELDQGRVIALSAAAQRWPAICGELERLLAEKPEGHTRPLHEFLALRADPEDPSLRLTPQEQAFCRKLAEHPLSLRQAAEWWGADLYAFSPQRLEQRGAVIRCGLTPTDIMHLRGDYTAYNLQGAALAARFVAASLHIGVEQLCDRVYDLVASRLYCNLVRVLLEQQDPKRFARHSAESLQLLAEQAWQQAHDPAAGAGFLVPGFTTPLALVGIGAPIHLFLPRVARALGAPCYVPPQAPVANALGAIVGRVEVKVSVVVRPDADTGGFWVHHGRGNRLFEDQQQAEQYAAQLAQQDARQEAALRGLTGQLNLHTQVTRQTVQTNYNTQQYIASQVTVHVAG